MLIDENEFDQCMDEIQRREIINADFIEHIRARDTDEERKAYIYTKLKSCFFDVIKKRKKIAMPSTEEYIETINEISVSEEEILNENMDSDESHKENTDVKQ